MYDSHPQFSSVHFSRSVVSDSLRPHESQHARPPKPGGLQSMGSQRIRHNWNNSTHRDHVYIISITKITCVYLCTHVFVSVICMYLYMHQYFCAYIPSPHDTKSQLIGKDPDAGKDWQQEEKGTTEDEMAGWHHWLDGHESEWTLGDGDGQGGLACCDSWGREESDTTERLKWTELNWGCESYT